MDGPGWTNTPKNRPKKCWGPEDAKHRKGCRLGRPLCRWRRREKGLCRCEAYHYPHRPSANCGIPAAILNSPSYRKQAA